VVADPGRALGGKERFRRGPEEVEHVLVGERRRVRDVHHDIGPGHDLFHSLTGQGVHPVDGEAATAS